MWKKSLKIPKGYSESVYRRRTDNTMTKRKSTKGQTTYPFGIFKLFFHIIKGHNYATILVIYSKIKFYLYLIHINVI
jgi:hypothetical protein